MFDPPADKVMKLTYVIRDGLHEYADEGAVDSGFGLGEGCLDFWVNGEALRVIVSRVPVLDRGQG